MPQISLHRLHILQLLRDHGELSGGELLELDSDLPRKSIYVILAAMEKRKWIASRVQKIPGERNRPRRFYHLTELGKSALDFAQHETGRRDELLQMHLEFIEQALKSTANEIDTDPEAPRIRPSTGGDVAADGGDQTLSTHQQPANQAGLTEFEENILALQQPGVDIINLAGIYIIINRKFIDVHQYSDLLDDFIVKLNQRRAEVGLEVSGESIDPTTAPIDRTTKNRAS